MKSSLTGLVLGVLWELALLDRYGDFRDGSNLRLATQGMLLKDRKRTCAVGPRLVHQGPEGAVYFGLVTWKTSRNLAKRIPWAYPLEWVFIRIKRDYSGATNCHVGARHIASVED